MARMHRYRFLAIALSAWPVIALIVTRQVGTITIFWR